MGPLMDRLADAIQREHELLVELQTLATELLDHVERQRAMTDRLQLQYETNVVALPPSEEFSMPAALRGGPLVRDKNER